MPSVTINIAGRGTKLAGGGESAVGHMWYELTDDQGQTTSYGFAPDEEHHGSPFAPGQVYNNDNTNYQSTEYSRTIEVTDEQFAAMQAFGQDPAAGGFSMRYNGLSNSCIDFTWKALEKGGLNPSGFEGHIWPTHNINAVKKIENPSAGAVGARAPPAAGGAVAPTESASGTTSEAPSSSSSSSQSSSEAGGGGGGGAGGGGGGGGGSSSGGSGAIQHVCQNAVLMCTFGMAPSTLGMLPLHRMMTSNMLAATIMDFVPFVNIMPFGMCTSPSNPTVAAATAAAMGVLTPMPCVPLTVSPWSPGSATVKLNNFPALNKTSMLNCTWGGVISITFPGQVTENIP